MMAAVQFFTLRSSNYTAATYPVIVGLLNLNSSHGSNQSAAEPYGARFASAKQISNFMWFVEQDSPTIWPPAPAAPQAQGPPVPPAPAAVQPPIRFTVRLEGGGWYNIKY